MIDCDSKVDKEEDWLPPAPKNSRNTEKILDEDSTIKALRYNLYPDL